MRDVAEDSLRIFRVNLFVIAVYSSILAVLYNSGGDFEPVLSSDYTFIGLLLWFGATGTAILIYSNARRLSTAPLRENPERIEESLDEVVQVKNVVAVAATVFLAVYFFVVGVYDGLVQPVNLSEALSGFGLVVGPVVIVRVALEGFGALLYATGQGISRLTDWTKNNYHNAVTWVREYIERHTVGSPNMQDTAIENEER